MSIHRNHPGLRRLHIVARWMDSRFRIPGTRIRFGLDSVLGLVPGIGDSITALSGIYFVSQAHALGVPFGTKARMVLNTLIDMIIGAIPLVGDIFDIGFKANSRNVALIERHLARSGQAGCRVLEGEIPLVARSY